MSFPRLVPALQPSASALEARSDDELMRLCQAGAREAFAVLVARHAMRVVRTCARFANDFELGRELAQDTWVSVWEHRDRYRAENGFLVWLLTIARNRCRNHLRSSKVATRHTQTIQLGDSPTPTQIDGLLERERRAQVRSGLAQLSPALREALLLRYGDELRYDEMAPLLETGESTLRSRVHHGLKALRSLLEKRR